MGKNLARLELQVFLEELSRRLPHMRLAEQRFSYVPNISFRGPEHLWVQWDPRDNPERRDPALLDARQPVRIGESTRATGARLVRVASLRPVAERVLEIELEPDDQRALPRWSPGAHVELECGDTGLSRPYSLCGDPDDARSLRVAVLREPEGRGGSNWIHTRLRVGERLRLRGPRNHFGLDENAPSLVFVAGGIGITPIAAMALRARRLGMDYVLHYSGHARAGMAYVDELRALHGERLRLHAADQGARADYARELRELPAGCGVYACGPQRLLDALQELSAAWPPGTLRVERFQGGASALDPTKEHAFDVELSDSGQRIRVGADQTLLQALRAANIDLPSDCCEGLCGSCEVRVLEGEVEHRDVVLTPTERARNDKMMACCSRAAGTRLVLEL
jgi:ferredoxin-NADP reductase